MKKTIKISYENCKDTRKEVHWNVCKYLKKNIYMFCGLTNKICPVFKDYAPGDDWKVIE